MSRPSRALAVELEAAGLGGFVVEHPFALEDEECARCRGGGRDLGVRPGTTRKCGLCRGRGFVTVGRRWRLDFAWLDARVAVEVDGGGWVRGRHHRPQGYAKDCEKINAATLQGWRVLRVTPEHVRSGQAVEWVRAALGREEE